MIRLDAWPLSLVIDFIPGMPSLRTYHPLFVLTIQLTSACLLRRVLDWIEASRFQSEADEGLATSSCRFDGHEGPSQARASGRPIERVHLQPT